MPDRTQKANAGYAICRHGSFICCFELTVIRSTIDMIQTCKSTIENKSLK